MKSLEISFLLPQKSLMSVKDVREFFDLLTFGIENAERNISLNDLLSALLISLSDDNILKSEANQKTILQAAKAVEKKIWWQIKKDKPKTMFFNLDGVMYRYENKLVYVEQSYRILNALLNKDAD